MPTKCAIPIKYRTENLDEHIRKFYIEYQESDVWKSAYGSHFLYCLQFWNKPFNIVTSDDFKNLIAVLKKNNAPDTVKNYISSISSIKSYFINKQDPRFPSGFLDGIEKEKIIGNPSDAEALTLAQLAEIRAFFKDIKNRSELISEYIFELIFQLKIEKKGIMSCAPQMADKDRRVFTIEDNEIQYNEKIAQLIEKNSEGFEDKWKPGRIDTSLKHITKHLSNWNKSRDLKYNDIVESHRKYVIQCPNCPNKAENLADNWVLVRIEPENNYRLVCSECKGRRI